MDKIEEVKIPNRNIVDKAMAVFIILTFTLIITGGVGSCIDAETRFVKKRGYVHSHILHFETSGRTQVEALYTQILYKDMIYLFHHDGNTNRLKPNDSVDFYMKITKSYTAKFMRSSSYDTFVGLTKTTCLNKISINHH